jgi:hypothetical protein
MKKLAVFIAGIATGTAIFLCAHIFGLVCPNLVCPNREHSSESATVVNSIWNSDRTRLLAQATMAIRLRLTETAESPAVSSADIINDALKDFVRAYEKNPDFGSETEMARIIYDRILKSRAEDVIP